MERLKQIGWKYQIVGKVVRRHGTRTKSLDRLKLDGREMVGKAESLIVRRWMDSEKKG